ncbi:ABC transporter ATP-binding protein [Trueperella pyogenes]|uniref:ABC transporter ATP-binding protein n=1 Tax=Trueperella pyogenes TaxID=1661 RepID=UPI00324F10CD
MTQTFSNMLRLMRSLRECMPLFVASTVVTALAQVTLVGVTVTSVWISTQFITDVDAPLAGFVALLFALVAGHGLGTLLEVWWSHEVAYRILHTFRIHIYQAIKRIAPVGLQGRRTGDVASAAMDDAEKLEWFYAHTASTIICAVVSPSIFVAVLCWLIGPLGLIMLFPILTMIALPIVLLPLQQKQGRALRGALVDLRIAVLDSIQGQRELRSLGMVANQQAIIDGLTKRVQRIMSRQSMRKAWESSYAAISTSVCSTILLVILTGRVLNGQLEGAFLPVAIVLAGMSTAPALTLVGMLGKFGELGACATRINEILDARDPIPSRPVDVEKLLGEEESLVAAQVSFAYDGQRVLKEVSVDVRPHRSIAIVGASGAGKTTFANLAMRFLDPDAGTMRFSGTDLRGYAPDEYRQKLALIPQDCHIFAGSIRNNLTLARPDSSDEEIWQALRAAQIASLVESLGGLDAHVGDRGTTLSGGERQRIGIARAILRDPELLILDEPLANIDPFLESQIAAHIKQLRSGRATIVIAHRLASIRIADHVVVLDNGTIVAQGTHAELLNDVTYRKLLGDQISARTCSPE